MVNNGSSDMPRKPQRLKSLDNSIHYDDDDEGDSDIEIDIPLNMEDGAQRTPPTTRRKQPGSKSPSLSPDPAKPSSLRSNVSSKSRAKSRSRSPRASALQDPFASSHSTTIHSKSPGTPKSESTSTRNLSRSPGKKTATTNTQQKLHIRKSPREVKQCIDLPTQMEAMLSFEEDVDEIESLPGLVDHYVEREKMEGNRGGRQWNIEEDTPAGHADEKMVIVEAIENDEESRRYAEADEEVLEEDDDIIDDPDEHSMAVASFRRVGGLPTDPSVSARSLQSQQHHSGRDRFDPSFNNREMWNDDEYVPEIHRYPSGDVSLLSDCHAHEELESVSEQGNPTLAALIDPPTRTPEMTISTGTGSGKTPATTKQSGSRLPANIGIVPNLEVDSVDEDLPASVPEDEPLDNSNSNSRRRTKRRNQHSVGKGASGRHEHKGSNSTGRSSQRKSVGRGRKERDALHGRKHTRRIPDVVPTTPGVDGTVRSPMSSSITSTPNSLISSLRSRDQLSSLEALKSQNSRRILHQNNTPLNLHVGQGREVSNQMDGDDHTLGASTITTNFSSTQRTRGDNTVSTRSLFRSERMSVSETPKIPLRRRAGSDYEGSDDDGVQATEAKSPQDMIDKTGTIPPSSESDAVHEWQGNLDDPFNRMQALVSSPSPKTSGKAVLRRPSGENDKLLLGPERTGPGNTVLRRPSGELQAMVTTNTGPSVLRRPSSEVDVLATMKTGTASLECEVIESLRVSSMGDIEQDETRDKFEMDSSALESHNLGIWHAPDSPTELLKKKKKKRGLFRRVKSWKGVVALDDDEDV